MPLSSTNAPNLPMEFERKFLLAGVPPAAGAVAPRRIEQGWLPGTVIRERIRRTTYADGTVLWTRTIKSGGVAARLELEEATDAALGEALWPLTAAARIVKDRHVVPDGTYRWEIDVFRDRDLVLAEVETADPDDRPSPPAWLAPHVVRDVSEDPMFLNAVLARPAEMVVCLPSAP